VIVVLQYKRAKRGPTARGARACRKTRFYATFGACCGRVPATAILPPPLDWRIFGVQEPASGECRLTSDEIDFEPDPDDMVELGKNHNPSRPHRTLTLVSLSMGRPW
jgi:hypothetical protein